VRLVTAIPTAVENLLEQTLLSQFHSQEVLIGRPIKTVCTSRVARDKAMAAVDHNEK
jgi:hypothetical protein